MMRILRPLALLPFLLSVAAAQDGGKIDWKGKGAPSAGPAIDAFINDQRPVLLFFTSEGNADCTDLSAGAFSDLRVVDAASKIGCVFIECSGKRNADLVKVLQVTKFPDLILLGPDGTPLGRLAARDAAGILAALTDLAQNAAHLPRFTEDAEGALRAARAKSLPLVLYFYDESPASLAVNRSLTDNELKPLRDKVVFARCLMKKGTDLCVKYEVERAPTILVIDTSLKTPESRPLARIAGSRNPRELRRDLDEALAAPRGGAGVTAAPGTIPAPSAPKEELSDDQLDRKFIQARIGVANNLIKQGKTKEAIDVLQDVVKSYPKHVATIEAAKLLEQLNSKK